MAVINVTLEDTFNDWRVKTNGISTALGDIDSLSGYTATDAVGALNETKTNASFYNQIEILDQANDNETKIVTNGDSMIIQVDGSATLTLNDLGDVTVANDATVQGDLSAGSLTTTNNVTVGTGLSVTGTSTLTNTVTMGANASVGGNLTVTGTANVTGNTTLAGTLGVTGVANLTSLAVSGGVAVSGVTTLNGNLVCDAGFTANQGAVFNGNTTIGNASSDTLSVTAGINTSVLPSTDNSKNIGGSSQRWANMFAVTFNGNATTANYADLAEKYLADGSYEPGTVMSVGGEKEITPSTCSTAHSILGVVSAYPAYLMNGNQEGGTPIALKGRVPVRVKGDVKKGDRLTVSDEAGIAEVNNAMGVWSFAIALEDGTNLVEAVIL